MLSRSSVVAILVLGALSPLVTSALTQSEIETEISGLMAEISSLQEMLFKLSAKPTVPPPAPEAEKPIFSSQPKTCPTLPGDLARGASGPAVLHLQQYLEAEGFFGGEPSGYYGLQTEMSVKAWQRARGVASDGTPATTGYGAVGPRTRLEIAKRCSSTVSPSSCLPALPPTSICSTSWQPVKDARGCTVSFKCAIPLAGYSPAPSPAQTSAVNLHGFKASATYGSTPLVVYFTTEQTALNGDSYLVNFGDDSSPTRMQGEQCSSTYPLKCIFRTGHVYEKSGTFTATLIREEPSGARKHEGTAAITVGSAQSTASPSVQNSLISSLSIDKQTIQKGQQLRISWNASSQNSSVVGIWLRKGTGELAGILARAQPLSGSYTWTVPSASSASCADCGGVQTIATGTYIVAAQVYSPSSAWLGDTFPPANPVNPTYYGTEVRTASFTIF